MCGVPPVSQILSLGRFVAKLSLNSTQSQFNLRLRWSLFPFDPATHPPAGKVSFSLNANPTPSQPQLNRNSTQPQLKLLSLALLSSGLLCKYCGNIV